MLSELFDNPIVFSMFRLFVHNSFKGRLKEFEALNMTGKEKVIDICCGTGHFSTFLPQNYIGVDNNPNYIKYALLKYKKKFMLQDVTNLKQFASKSFDIAFIIDCLHHFSDDLAEKVISEACRLAPKIVIIDMPTQSEFNVIAKLLEKLDRGKNVRTVEEESSLISRFINIKAKKIFSSGIYKELIITGESI